MASRNELNARAAVVGITAASYPNDSKLEQKVLFAEKNASSATGTIATTTLTTDTTNNSNGDTITIGSTTLTFVTALSEATASGTLTSTGVFADTDTVTIEGQTYLFKTTLDIPAQVNEVLIGANAAASLTNLKAAINGGAGLGSLYASGTVANTKVTATTLTATTLLVVALKPGISRNQYITTAVSANNSWGATTLTGGAEVVAGQVLIAGTATLSLSAVKDAILGTAAQYGVTISTGTAPMPGVTATTLTATTLLINANDFAVGNTIATTSAAAHLSFTGTVMASGVAKVIAPNTTTTTEGVAGISGDNDLV